MLSKSQIGSRLRAAREQCEISLEEAADALGVRPADISGLESGQRAIATLEVTRLADIYHYPAACFFLEDAELGENDLPVALNREFSKRKFAPGVRAAIWQMLDLCGEVMVLRGMLNRPVKPTLPNYTTQQTDKFDCPRQEGEFAAGEERRRLRLGDQPVPNVSGLIRDQDIWAAATELPDDLSGLFVNHSDVGLVILVNQQDSPVRRRFSYLHELAHALFDRSDGIVMMTRPASGQKPDPVEIRADAFAAAFLMPKEGIAGQLEKTRGEDSISYMRVGLDPAHNVRGGLGSQEITCQDTAILAHHFGVGYEVAVARLSRLNFIGSAEKETLDQRKREGKEYIDSLGCSGPPENPESSEGPEKEIHNHLLHLAFEAFRKKQISRSRLMGIGRKLNIDRDELFEIFDATILID